MDAVEEGETGFVWRMALAASEASADHVTPLLGEAPELGASCVEGGVFDHGVTDLVVHPMPKTNMEYNDKKALR